MDLHNTQLSERIKQLESINEELKTNKEKVGFFDENMRKNKLALNFLACDIRVSHDILHDYSLNRLRTNIRSLTSHMDIYPKTTNL